LSAVAIALAIILFLLGIAKITDLVFPKKDKSNVRKPISLYILLYSFAILIIAHQCSIFFTPIIQNNYNNLTLSLSTSAFFFSLSILGILGIITMIVFIAISISIQRKERTGVQWGSKAIDLANSEKYDEALECYNKALEADPYNAKTWCNRGVLMGKLQRNDDAIKSFEKAIEIDPTYEIAKKAKENFLSELTRTR
jgi:tetratricopeptide (TPR) repeat protein